MKAPQERKTAKRIERVSESGHPNIKLFGNDGTLTVTEILESRNDSVTFRNREQIETLRDFCDAWLEHDEDEE
jgi:hypothetical protein